MLNPDLLNRIDKYILILVMAYELAITALADPTRRRLVDRLRTRPHAVGELVRHLRVTQPAVSQHLKVLKEAGLVADRPEGTRRVYYIDPHGLGALRGWLDERCRFD